MMERRIWKPNNVETSPCPSSCPCPTCPRCGSTNTKFCYYNNYSLTQPRYFCKSCRRYWTKGGSLRNVPVGGGCRRKTTRSSSSSIHHHHVTVTSNIISSCSITGSLPPPVTQGSDDGRPSIDLALVYANFLNPKLPNVVGSSPLPPPPPPPPLQFSGATDNLESHEPTTDGNQFYNFDCGMNSFDEKQQTSSSTVDHHYHHQMDCNNDYPLVLPPYLGSEEMVWPSSSDLIISPGDPVINAANYNDEDSTIGISPRVQDSNRVDDQHGSGLFHVPNFGIFPDHDDN